MYALRPGLSFCVIDDTTLFLDVPRDRYFALSPDLSRTFADIADALRMGRMIDPTLTRPLLARNVLIETGGSHRSWVPTLTPPRTEWRSPSVDQPGLGSVLRALLCITRTCIRLQLLPLRAVVGAERAEPSRLPTSDRKLDRLMTAFSSSLKIWPWQLECLPMSIALQTFLAACDVDADLIFAVKLNPFAAHCWVQIGDRVMGDTLEHVSPFTPIRRAR